MADEGSEMMRSAAYLALTPAGKRALNLIGNEIKRAGVDVVALPRLWFMANGMSRAAISYGTRQCQGLGFIKIEVRPRNSHMFRLTHAWEALDGFEAKRLVQAAKLPLPVTAAARNSPAAPQPRRVKKVARQSTAQRGVPSLPTLTFLDHQSRKTQ
jgi:hypothetical protein